MTDPTSDYRDNREQDAPTFADRYPQDRGRVLWCVECGTRCPAELLDRCQLCPECVRWWRDNPPPGDEEADDGY